MKVSPGLKTKLRKPSKDWPSDDSNAIFWALFIAMIFFLALSIAAVHEKSHPKDSQWLITPTQKQH